MRVSTTRLGVWIVCTLLCAWLLAAQPPRAHARPLRALVCVEDGDDGSLLERVRGQTGDLAVRLVPVPCGLTGDFEAQLARAKEVAAARAAELAVWFVRRPPRLVIYVAEPSSERVLARGLDEGSGMHAASARDETAALVVRSAVRAALAGAALDTPASERAAVVTGSPVVSAPPAPAPTVAPTPAPAPAPPPPVQAARAAPPARAPVAATGRRVDVWLSARAQAALDGFATSGRFALGGRLGVRAGWFEAGVGGLAGLTATRDVALGRLSLARHRLGAYGAVALLSRATLRIALEVEGGAELARLRVEQADSALQARASRTLLAYAGAQLRASYAPRWGRGRLALAPAVGVVVMPERPSLGYVDDGAFVRVRRLYLLEPAAEIAVAVRF